jgi:hypothetical protein
MWNDSAKGTEVEGLGTRDKDIHNSNSIALTYNVYFTKF